MVAPQLKSFEDLLSTTVAFPKTQEVKKELTDRDVQEGFDITLTKHKGQVIDEFGQNVHFVETDIKENPEIAKAASIMGTPCVQFFKNNENLRLFFFYTPGAGPTVKSGSKGKRHRLILTKTLEWTLNWCILHGMFDRYVKLDRAFLVIDFCSYLRYIF
ncbi:uncharacterized protein LOC132800374 [Ziziphus jujuba]|uniref:Uncharacterized protein LOC132800374 n=1 Tax=Ziziphus jujuba TaxID=326968 RepID=A0ABM3ZZH9_ZIZJJ|nr:uncharacterized protein LOC132800374 [Ziziphus jujuba]